ncbi:MAG: Rrf2 family transcriptional regulator [Planctomycetota bacterium]|nr:Rrf2 family transcriptional regulator [Planctomycetota bacterium]
MQVTRAVDYGIRALMLMSGQPVGTRHFLQDLAQQGDLPRNYLVKVLKSLACVGIVRSHRGIKGGFSLGRVPSEITLRQVVEAIDGPVHVMHCIADARSCNLAGRCAPEVFFRELRAVILRSLENSTLQDLLDMQRRIDNGTACETCAEHDLVRKA